MPVDPIAAALRHYEQRQELAAHNLANVDTAGFKAERPFARLLATAAGPAASPPSAGARPGLPESAAAEPGGPLLDAYTDLRPGPVHATGAPLDLALTGPGFFVVQTTHGERWTRGGSFTLNGTGEVTDSAGALLLGVDGPLVVPAGTTTLTVGPDGRVAADARPLGRLRVEAPPVGTLRLRHAAGGYLEPTPGRHTLAETSDVRQGALEGSNVNPVNALVELITIQRAYATIGQAHATREAVEDRSTELGKPV